MSWRIQKPGGFYSEVWDEVKQEEDKWQTPDKFQKISKMVFRNRVLEIHPVGDGVLSSPRVQHQGVNVTNEKNMPKISKCGEGLNSNPTQEQ